MHRSAAGPIERGRLWEQWVIQKIVSINAYQEEFPKVPCEVVYGGEESRSLDFAQLMPAVHFLKQLREDRR